ncbi:MAG: hypothetical protein JWL86_3439 [Rhizobium sp.]|nr:hypothetical protein [Rhizobium sp.]
MRKGDVEKLQAVRSYTLFSTAPGGAAASRPATTNTTTNARAPVSLNHPVFTPANQIVHSIRLLAETAQAWQFASPRLDPNGDNTRGSFERLRNAMEIINGQLLMISVNERFSLENGLVLRTEIQEHDLHLDSIVARTREAGMRLGLRDLLAFHSSGITDADIQAAIGIIQQAILINISGKL